MVRSPNQDALTLMRITPDLRDVQPLPRCLYIPTYAQGSRQCRRRPRSRRGALRDHADWAPAALEQEFIRNMETTLPTGDTEQISPSCVLC